MTDDTILETFRSDANLRLASPEALGALAARAQRLHFDKGEYIFGAGEDSNLYYLVESGRVVLFKPSPSGKQFTYLLAVRGVPLNAVTCFGPRLRSFSARVAEAATVVAIPCHVFRRWVLDNPEVAGGILNTLGDLLDGAYTRIMDIIDESAETRVLNALSMLSSKIGLTLPLTNSDVAEMTGVSRETAARIISRLQDVGLLSKARGTITILDADQLAELTTSPVFML